MPSRLLSSLGIAAVLGFAGYYAGSPKNISTINLNAPADFYPDVVIEDNLGRTHIHMGIGREKTMPLEDTDLLPAQKEYIKNIAKYLSEKEKLKQGDK